MRRLGVAIALGAWGICLQAQGAIGVCGFYRDAYQGEILKKIQSGIPFELMATLFEEGALTHRRVSRITFNLWDEIVSVQTGEQTPVRFALKDAPSELCKSLEIDAADVRAGRKYVYRLFLNPMWSERMMRLQVSTGRRSENLWAMGIDWKKIAEDMPSEKLLLEKEIHR